MQVVLPAELLEDLAAVLEARLAAADCAPGLQHSEVADHQVAARLAVAHQAV